MESDYALARGAGDACSERRFLYGANRTATAGASVSARRRFRLGLYGGSARGHEPAGRIGSAGNVHSGRIGPCRGTTMAQRHGVWVAVALRRLQRSGRPSAAGPRPSPARRPSKDAPPFSAADVLGDRLARGARRARGVLPHRGLQRATRSSGLGQRGQPRRTRTRGEETAERGVAGGQRTGEALATQSLVVEPGSDGTRVFAPGDQPRARPSACWSSSSGSAPTSRCWPRSRSRRTPWPT
jgi:hypothetical protein